MPPYPWLLKQKLDTAVLPARIRALRTRRRALSRGLRERRRWTSSRPSRPASCQNLKVGMVEAAPDREIIALIAYLQRLGTDIKNSPASTAPKLATN